MSTGWIGDINHTTMDELYATSGISTQLIRRSTGVRQPAQTSFAVAIHTRGEVRRARQPKGTNLRGWKPPLPYYRYYEQIIYPSGYALLRSAGDFNLERVGTWGQLWNPQEAAQLGAFADGADRLVTLAVNDALGKLKDSKVNLAVAMLEARETAKTLTSSATKIAQLSNKFSRFVTDLRRGRTPRAFMRSSDWKKVPAAWLQYQFAVKPLVMDVHGSVQALIIREKDGDVRFMVSVKGKASSTASSILPYGADNGYNLTGSRVQTHGARVRLDVVPTEAILRSLSNLGVSNPAAAAWEATRMSWLIDYFLNVGDVLEGLNGMSGFKWKGGSYSVKLLDEETVVPRPDDKRIAEALSKGRRKTLRMYRVPYAAPPHVLPVFKPDITPPRFANIMAVFVSSLQGMSRATSGLRI